MVTKNARLFLKFLAFIWLTFIIFRVAFLVWQWPALSQSSWQTILKAFYIGLRFDGRIAIYTALPLLLFLFTPFLGRFFDKIRTPLLWFYTLLFAFIFLLYWADFAHYAYLQMRSNFSAVSLMEDTKEAVFMIWETYPVIKITLGTLILAVIYNRITKKLFSTWSAEKTRVKAKVVSSVLCILLTAILIYGQYSINLFPLRWSQAYFSGDTDITALALNPIHNLYDTMPKKNDKTYDIDFVREVYPLVAEHLQVDNPDEERLRFDRFAGATSSDTPNVVLIIIESMTTHKSTFMFDELQTTPFLVNLANDSLYFPNYYASARTTAKAMYSIITGIPDANPAFSSSSRDPGAVDQHVIWNEFKDYSKFFMMGGNANWANIRGVLTNNIKDLVIFEEGYWKAPISDVWGITDLDLLKETHQILKKQEKPFFAVILTAAFHRPFTVPKGIEGFDYTMESDEFVRHYGLVPEEYVSMRFCDFAIQEYFKLAKDADYYDNTIFVITGDHGISERSPAAPETYQRLKLHEYQVPLIIHYPKKFSEPQVMDQSGGHIDLFPTIAGITGIEYQNTTFGRDLLEPRYGDDRWTFIMRSDMEPALLNNKYLYAANIGGGGEFFMKETLNATAEDWVPAEISDEEKERLDLLTRGIKESAIFLLYNNSKKSAAEARERFLAGQSQ